MKQLTFTESQLVAFIKKNFASRYSEIEVVHKKNHVIYLWNITDTSYDLVLAQELPAAVFEDEDGNYVFRTLNMENQKSA